MSMDDEMRGVGLVAQRISEMAGAGAWALGARDHAAWKKTVLELANGTGGGARDLQRRRRHAAAFLHRRRRQRHRQRHVCQGRPDGITPAEDTAPGLRNRKCRSSRSQSSERPGCR